MAAKRRPGRPPAYRPFPAEPLERIRPLGSLGTNGASRRRMREVGLSALEADRLACEAGVHPSAVWGDLWYDAAGARTDTDRLFAQLRRELGLPPKGEPCPSS